MIPEVRYFVWERKRPNRFRKKYSRAYTKYEGDSHEVAEYIVNRRKAKHPNRYLEIYTVVTQNGEVVYQRLEKF